MNFRANATYFHFGLNVARFFSKKIIAGVCFDHKGAKGFFGWSTGSDFASAFEAGFSPILTSPADSAKSTILLQAFTSSAKPFYGNYLANIGFMFSPFPQKYGGILVEVKRGMRSFPIDGYYGNPYIENHGSDFAFFDVGKVLTTSLYFKPLIISKRSVNKSFSDSMSNWRHRFILGFHYERMNLEHGEFYGINFAQIVSPQFMNDFGIQNRFGITIGFGIY